MCGRCNYPSISNENFIDEYLGASDAANASTLYINASDSHVSEYQISSNRLQISRVRSKMLQNTESKLNIRLWELDEQDIIEVILDCSVFNSHDDMEIFITEQSKILETLRRAMHFQFESTGSCCNEVTEFQPLLILFLEPFAEYFRSGSVVKCAQSLLLEGSLFIGGDSHEKVEKIIKGHTDVIVFDTHEDQTMDHMVCHLELKPPCGPLHHSHSFKEKDQLMIESEIIGQMLANNFRVFGGITDLFAIAIMVRVPFHLLDNDSGSNNSNSNRPVSFISHRVVHSRSFLLRLMLLFGIYDDTQWSRLLSRSKTMLVLNDNEEEEEENKCSEGDKPPRTTDGNVASRTRAAAAIRVRSSFYSDDNEDILAESTKRLLQWECKRHGLSYLSEDELNRRNGLQSQSKTRPEYHSMPHPKQEQKQPFMHPSSF